jgi:hypothetical protein
MGCGGEKEYHTLFFPPLSSSPDGEVAPFSFLLISFPKGLDL